MYLKEIESSLLRPKKRLNWLSEWKAEMKNRKRLAEANLRLVVASQRYVGRGMLFDLIQEGNLGLISVEKLTIEKASNSVPMLPVDTSGDYPSNSRSGQNHSYPCIWWKPSTN